MTQLPNAPWSISSQDILNSLEVDRETGLSEEKVEQSRQKYGMNRLQQAKQRGATQILIDQFKSPIIGLLAGAAVLSFVLQDWVEAIAIIVAILVNTVIGFVTEWQATRSMEALQQLSHTTTKVRRDRNLQEIPSEELVPGDIIILDSGDIIAADLRIIEANSLNVNESSLTGESVPVTKKTQLLDADIALADRHNMLYKGTAITQGSGEGIVVATGMKTELGRISELTTQGTHSEQTPLEKRLDQLGKRLIQLTLLIVVFVAISGIIGGRDLILMVQTAIALAVGAVPEGLPIVATVALARGMWRMAKRQALINRLSAVETLGATGVICTDKTGTLTENQMTASYLITASGEIEIEGEGLEVKGQFYHDKQTVKPLENELLKAALEIGVLCNNAALQPQNCNESRVVGDPMEVALLVAGAKANLSRNELLKTLPEVKEDAFDPDLKMMATWHQIEDKYRVVVKGAPESVLDYATQILTSEGIKLIDQSLRNSWQQRSEKLASEGLRILGLAEKTTLNDRVSAYEDLVFVGLVGLLDPPRQDVCEAIKQCQKAGIRVIMVTGDQPMTACNIGKAVGLTDEETVDVVQGKELKSIDELSNSQRQRLLNTSIFARVSPEQKLNLIALHQSNNAVVAMTGDGVNDAPALKKADIGVAMGQRGTQVAQEAADMVLQDDAFSTIVEAVAQGRAIFDNIRKFTIYLLSGNVGEILAVGIMAFLNAPLPLLPLQILYINFVNDAFPALALGVGEGSPKIMDRPPRNAQESVLTRRHWLEILGYGVVIMGVILGAFMWAWQGLGMSETEAITVSFMTLGFTRLWHVFNMRNRGSGLFRNEITQNPYVWAALILCSGLLLLAVYLPGLSNVLETAKPSFEGWLLIIGMSFVPLIIGQFSKLFVSD
ncbi:MAG: cation-translocating P-type ATPase [Microcoleaceae cyanobacterium]